MELELTKDEIEMVLSVRRRKAYCDAYNEGLRDAYNIVTSTMPMSETRTEITEILQRLYKDK